MGTESPSAPQRYRVFISYNHLDTPQASKLEDRLRSLEYPVKGLRNWRQPRSLPLRSIFRDRSSAPSGGALSSKVKDWLDRSEALVVICSRNSASPNPETGTHWVNDEVLHFISTGKADRIFPYIIDTESGELSARELLPPAIADADLVASDARSGHDGDEYGFLKLVAGLLGLEITDLHDAKTAIEKRNRELRAYLFSAFGIFALLLAALSYVSLANSDVARREGAISIATLAEQAADRGSYDRALILGLASADAWQRNGEPVPLAYDALRRALSHNSLRAEIFDYEATIDSIQYSNSGGHVGIIWRSGRVIVLDVENKQLLYEMNIDANLTLNTVIDFDTGIVVSLFERDDQIYLTLYNLETGGVLYQVMHEGFARRITLEDQYMIVDLVDKDIYYKRESNDHIYRVNYGDASHVSVQPIDLGSVSDVSVAISNSLGLIAVNSIYSSQIVLRDLETMQLVAEIDPEWPRTVAMTFGDTGAQFAAGGDDGRVGVWSATGVRSAGAFAAASRAIRRLSFSPDGEHLGGSVRNLMVVWNAASGERQEVYDIDPAIIVDFSFSANGRNLYTASDDFMVRVWRLGSQEPVAALPGHTNWLQGVVASPSGSGFTSSARDGSVRVWSLARSALLEHFNYPESAVYTADYSNDGSRVLVPRRYGNAALISVPDARTIAELDLQWSGLMSGAFCDSANMVAVLDGQGGLTLWRSDDGSFIDRIESSEGIYSRWTASFSDECGALLLTNSDGSVIVYDPTDLEVQIESGNGFGVNNGVMSPNGSYYAFTNASGYVSIYDAIRHVPVFEITSFEPFARSLAISPNSSLVAIGTTFGSIAIWDATSQETLMTFSADTRAIISLDFSDTAELLASVSHDGGGAVWNPRTGAKLFEFPGFGVRADKVSLSDEGYLRVEYEDGSLALWDVESLSVPPDQILQYACARRPVIITELGEASRRSRLVDGVSHPDQVCE